MRPPDDGPPGHPDGEPAGPERLAALTLSGYIALAGALLLHVMVGALLPLAQGLAPTWAMAVSAVVWVWGAVLLWRWHRARPIVTLFVPFGVLAVWWALLRAGQAWLGWGA